MVDFGKLRTQRAVEKPINPIEIFRHLPKPPQIADLYTSQAEVLSTWFERRNEKDTVIKLHTGGGKTLVGLLIAQSSINETKEPALYLVPTVQLMKQTIEKAKAIQIPAVPYVPGKNINDQFINSKAILVATYKALFNGKSKFGVKGVGLPQNVSCIILDDAHTAFSVIRDSFTLNYERSADVEGYKHLCNLFRQSFNDIDRLGTFDDVVSNGEYGVLEVPYWSWLDSIDEVREFLRKKDEFSLVWPLIRDKLAFCHALISNKEFSITPIHPFVNMFPTFSESRRRIYMSATIADDSEIIATFGASIESITNPLMSRSLAGISERMVLIPDLMKLKLDTPEIKKIVEWTVDKKHGVVLLSPSDEKADRLADIATVIKGSANVEGAVTDLQNGTSFGPYVFSNRYDGIDLPGDSCRLLILCGLPQGTSNYEVYKAICLWGASNITRMQAQRIEQGIGRGARGSGDYCVVILKGADLTSWVSKESNFLMLTSATKAQIEIGIQVSKEINNLKDLAETIKRCYLRDEEWLRFHAETLAELTVIEKAENVFYLQASVERAVLDFWMDGYSEKAISRIERFIAENKDEIGYQNIGWLEQYAARISYHWGNKDKAEALQKNAYSDNRNMLRPKILPPYRPLPIPGEQAIAITDKIIAYHLRKGFLQHFEDTIIDISESASANQFERALSELGEIIGFLSERHDENGLGPDVLWLLPEKKGFIIEAKSRKKEKNALTKDEHGQLLVAEEWFKIFYSEYSSLRISVHPKNKATEAACAGASYALTYENIEKLKNDVRSFLNIVCEMQLPNESLRIECERILPKMPFYYKNFVTNYLVAFETAR